MRNDIPRSSLALRGVRLFEGLPDTRLDAIAGACLWRHVEAEVPLMLRAQDGCDLLLLLSGSARVTTYAANGRQVTFRDARAGDHFGDLAALDGLPRSADVVTLETCLVATLPRADFLALLDAEPAVARRVMHGLAALVRQLSERVIDLSTLGVQNRLHAELLRLARAAGVADNRARLAPAPRHAALAAQVSTNREQVTRELNALARDGLLAKDAGALVVADVARLERLVAEVRN